MQVTTTWEDILYPGKATDFFTRRPFPEFDPATCAYNGANALWLAELSRLVYRDPPIPLPSNNSFPAGTTCVQHSFFVSQETETQALLAEFTGPSSFAVLAFRGIELTPTEIITALKAGIPPLAQNEISVHDGFAKALDSVWCEIEKQLAQLKCPVFYTGHSLGAALATLAAARRTPKAVYTFGSPRVGNYAFASRLTSVPIYRVVVGQDVIATVPPVALGFMHAGTEQRLIATSKEAWHNFYAPPKAFADHAPVNYVDLI